MRRIWVDGEEGKGLPPDDPGFLYGMTVFETFRTYGRTPFRFSAHMDRLQTSALEMGIPSPPRSLIEREIESVLGENVSVRYTLTEGGRRIVDVAPVNPSFVCARKSVGTLQWEPPSWLPGLIKHGSRASWIIAARRLGVDEVLFVDSCGFILEANRSNVFAVINGVLKTPPVDGRLLVGVTRGALIDAAQHEGIPIFEEPIHRDAPIEELYLSGSLKQLSPVVLWDSKPMKAGPVGRLLLEAFQSLVERETGK